MTESAWLKTPLFAGLTEADADKLLQCLQGERRSFRKGQAIYHMGDTAQALGLVLSGSAHIESCDAWGKRSLLGVVQAGQIFAEVYACVPEEPMQVSVIAAEPTEALFLRTDRMLGTCSTTCPFHAQLLRNLLMVMARKNLQLSQRMRCTAPRTIRERLTVYLSDQATRQGSNTFVIPFNRQELADYLEVDRSALSNELSKMRREGLLEVDRKAFTLSAETGME